MSKTVIITGAAKGIGKQIAIDFANLGYNVCINYNKSEKEAISLMNELALAGKSVVIYKANISKKEEVENMIDFVILNFGHIDVLVNNSGICNYGLFSDISDDDTKEIINTNLLGTLNVTKSVLNKSMVKSKLGSIINISSIWGITGASCEVVYSMTKAGIIGFTKSLAKELGSSNIRVNAVAPGSIDTEMMSKFSKEEIEDIKNEIPLARIGTVKDVSNTVLFLASDKSSYITGQVISPNGGVVI